MSFLKVQVNFLSNVASIFSGIKLIFANFANFGQFGENFFREKSKIDQFAKINSREVSTFPSFAKINSVLKFAKNAIFWQFLITRFYKGRILLHKEYNE